MTAKPELKLEDFPARTYDKIRRGEAVENHVNNILYPSFYDTGRTEITHDPALVELMSGNVWFVAHFAIDYHAEMQWPGTVEIGTGIRAIGRSSVTFYQALFQDGICAATSECVMVQVDPNTRRPAAFTDAAKEWLGKFM